MGRKIAMKKIEDVTKCQVTFSKRRSNLIKKAGELSICCDVDVALVAFAPSGRVSKYTNKARIEDVLERYVNLPAEKRLTQMENVEGKLEKLKQLSHIKGDTSKLHFLDDQVENLQLQIQKYNLELQILEANLRDYETPDHEPASLHQLSWCERNLSESLANVMARKRVLALGKMPLLPHQPLQMETGNNIQMLHSSNLTENEHVVVGPNPPTGDNLMKYDHWTNLSGAKVHDRFQDLLGQANIATPNMNFGPSNIYNLPLPESSNTFGFVATKEFNHQMSSMIPSMVDALPKLPDQINEAQNNLSLATYSDAVQMAVNFQAPRYGSSSGVAANVNTLGMPQPRYNEINEGYLQFPSLNCNKLNNSVAEEIIGQSATNFANNMSNANAHNAHVHIEGSFGMNSDQLQRYGHLHSPPYPFQQVNNTYPNTLFDTLPSQDVLGQNMPTQSAEQRNSSWNWEEVLDENYNFMDYPPKE